MSDWLDELLSQLPSEPLPELLIPQVRLQLAKVRRRERRIHKAAEGLAGAAGALGVGMLIHGLNGRMGPMVQPTPADLGAALTAASASPTRALMELASGMLGRAGSLETWFILAMSLLAFPALYAASRLLLAEPALKGAMS